MVRKLKELPKRMRIIHTNSKISKPKKGDIFTFSINEGEYMFGRVIADDATASGFCTEDKKNLVIYVYNQKSESKEDIPLKQLTLKNLLVDPIEFPFDYWRMGYFETVGYEEISEKNTHLPICFDNQGLGFMDYVDEHRNEIKKQKLIGVKGLWNIFGLEKEICRALGEKVEEYG